MCWSSNFGEILSWTRSLPELAKCRVFGFFGRKARAQHGLACFKPCGFSGDAGYGLESWHIVQQIYTEILLYFSKVKKLPRAGRSVVRCDFVNPRNILNYSVRLFQRWAVQEQVIGFLQQQLRAQSGHLSLMQGANLDLWTSCAGSRPTYPTLH